MSGPLRVAEGPALIGGGGVSPAARRPRLGFLGVGWIGRNRMAAVAASGVAEIAAIADPSAEMRSVAAEDVGGAELFDGFDALLEADLDGVVIATPSALHAEQSVRALQRGLAVFCQKPLGRTEGEARRVIDAAQAADVLLGVDFSYRHTRAMQRLKEVVEGGGIGDVYAADLVFHNAYGPDKAWFYDARLSGGGCVMDLGIHLVDLALWMLGFPSVDGVSSRLFSGGRRLGRDPDQVEDYAIATLDLSGGTVAQISCSWNLPAGCDAVISASFFGTAGGVRMRNVNGSFYDFVAERFDGTATQRLVEPPDAWGGRAAVDWARRVARGDRFDPGAERLVEVARAVDRIYGR